MLIEKTLTVPYRDNNIKIIMCGPGISGDFPMMFHADIKKIIHFWEYDSACIPSFIKSQNSRYIRSLNPDADNEKLNWIQRMLGYENFRRSEKSECIDIVCDDEYIKSSDYWLKDNPAVIRMGMPTVGVTRDKKEIKKLVSAKGFFSKGLLSAETVSTSYISTSFGNGRHRFRFLEFVGAKDVWIRVPRSEFKWFKENCAYNYEDYDLANTPHPTS